MSHNQSHTPTSRWILIAILTLAASSILCAQGLILPNEVHRPNFRHPNLVSQEVHTRIIDGTARVTVQQVFHNPNNWALEGTYVFPLPQDAVVSSFTLIQDGREWVAELIEADEARRIYQQIVHQRKDPALLEYVDQKSFKASIFPIPPGGESSIDLTYSQVLDNRNGLYVWGFPFPTNNRTFKDADLRFDVFLESRHDLGNVYSPQSQVELEQDDDRQAHASFEGEFEDMSGPFQIYYSLADKHFGMSLLAHRDGEEGTFMLMISPQRELEENEIIGKDIVFVLDRSGSMGGDKIRQARDALKYCLENLDNRDRFNIVAFSDNISTFQNDLVSARNYRSQGMQFVNRISSGGGTNIHDALERAISMDWDESRPRNIIFLTDGLPTIGNTDLESILRMVENSNDDQVRIFPFGVGHDVDAIFLDRIAQTHRGATEYVEPGENIETAVASFYNQIHHPVMSDPELHFHGINVDMMYPNNLPDMFAGNQLLILGRYTGNGEHRVELTGEVNGRRRTISHVVEFPRENLSNDFVDELWASRRIGFLLEEIRLHGENQELKDEVIAMSKQYGIATPYTSFLAREDEQLAHQPPQQQTVRDVRSALQSLPGVHVDQEGEFHFRGGRSHPVASKKGMTSSSAGAGLSSREERMGAIAESEIVRELKETVSLDECASTKKRVAGRTFKMQDNSWVETSYTDSDTTIDIKYDSEAYWDLLDQIPELAEIFALGEKVVLKVGKVYVRISDTGKETIARSEIQSWL